MPIERLFFDWSEPALPQAARWLLERFAGAAKSRESGVGSRERSAPPSAGARRLLAASGSFAPSADLSNVTVCVPTAQGRRRLLELLVERAAEQKLPLSPPRILTPGALPETLYQPKRPFASLLTQHLAWARVLKETKPAELAPLVRQPPGADDLPGWLALGRMLGDLHHELAAEGFSFESALVALEDLETFNEPDRWRLLARLQRQYLQVLDRLEIWDEQTARLFAIEHGECHCDFDLVLVGLVDLNRTQRQMLDRVAGRVTALVFAPVGRVCRTPTRAGDDCSMDSDATLRSGQTQAAAWQAGPTSEQRVAPRRQATFAFAEEEDQQAEDQASERPALGFNVEAAFDEHGCLKPAAWQDYRLAVGEDQIELVDAPAEQGDAVARQLATVGDWYAADDIVIGVPDARLAPLVQQRLLEAGVGSRSAAGRPIQTTGPYRLLALTADYLELRRFRDLAALARHPAVSRWLLSPAANLGVNADCLSLFDQYYAAHLPAYVTDRWPERGKGLAQMRQVQGVLVAQLGELNEKPRPLGQWAAAIAELLATIYGAAPLDEHDESDRQTIAACQAIRDAALELVETPGPLAPKIAGPAAIRLLLAQLDGAAIAPPADTAAIELVGWLDLPWNDAPVAIVTGMNEGCVSPVFGGDMFLPNALRRKLRLTDNDRHFARDLYALGMRASKERLHLVLGRRSVEKEPLAPSRLLFACDDGQLAARTRRLFAAPKPRPQLVLTGSVRPGRPATIIPIPEPAPLAAPVMSLRVTEFRDYLACPYRYYLRHRLRLVSLVDSAAELDGGSFGSLLHDALCEFSKSDAAQSTDVDRIRQQLAGTIGQLHAQLYGSAAQPAVRVQIELAKSRLEALAERQARWVSEGWRIHATELNFTDEQGATLNFGGQRVTLHGRIDRIDFNERDGRWAVLDYKSSERGENPDRVHRKEGQWIDLQLPLYRHLFRALGVADGAEPLLGYVLLPKDAGHCRFELAAWTPEELREADATAADIAKKIHAGKFWPAKSPPPDFFDEFSAICQDSGFTAAELAAALQEEVAP